MIKVVTACEVCFIFSHDFHPAAVEDVLYSFVIINRCKDRHRRWECSDKMACIGAERVIFNGPCSPNKNLIEMIIKVRRLDSGELYLRLLMSSNHRLVLLALLRRGECFSIASLQYQYFACCEILFIIR